MNLPSISSERIGPSTPGTFIYDSADTEIFIKPVPDNGWSENYEIKIVLQLKLPKEEENAEVFTSLILKPLYLKTQRNRGIKNPYLDLKNTKIWMV